MEEWPGAQAGFKSGFSGDCAANAMHGSIAPDKGSDQPRVRFSSFRGESRQDLNEEIQDSPQWVSTILRKERKGRESLFPLSFFRLSLLIRPISHTPDQTSALGSGVRRMAHKRIVLPLSCLNGVNSGKQGG